MSSSSFNRSYYYVPSSSHHLDNQRSMLNKPPCWVHLNREETIQPQGISQTSGSSSTVRTGATRSVTRGLTPPTRSKSDPVRLESGLSEGQGRKPPQIILVPTKVRGAQ